jgi:hypothetical protein
VKLCPKAASGRGARLPLASPRTLALLPLAVFALACKGASAPSIDLRDPKTLHAGLAFLAHQIVAADQVCADVADALGKGDPDKGLALAKACGSSSRKGLAALTVGEDLLNTGTSAGVACAFASGLDAIRDVAELLHPFNRPMPAATVDALAFGDEILAALGGAACQVGP